MFLNGPFALAAALSLLYACNARPLNTPRDVFPFREFVKINGYNYEIERLPLIDQDSNSDTYRFIPDPKSPEELSETLLKVVKKQEGINKGIVTEHERNLKKVDMLVGALNDPRDGRFYFFIIRDIRKGYEDSKELRPFHEWFLIDKNMDVDDKLDKLQDLVREKLFEFRDKYGLLYFDFHLGNFYVDEKFTYTMAKNWAPEKRNQGDDPEYGVVEMSKKREREFLELVEDTLKRDFSSQAFLDFAMAHRLPLSEKRAAQRETAG